MWKPVLRALMLAALPGMAAAAAPALTATATIVEGEAVLVRDATAFGLVEGVRLRSDDIVHTDPKGRFVRLELNDGTTVDLAPGARLMIGARLGRRTVPLYLLDGAVKLTLPNTRRVGVVLSSPRIELTDVAKGVVLLVSDTQTAVFAESGAATLVERADGEAQGAQTLRSGQFYQRSGDAKAQVSNRPTGPFIQQLPKAFLDTLPRRMDLFKGRDVPPRTLDEPGYDLLQPWIDAEAALRPGFVKRWRTLARNPDFRAGLVAGIANHPEWDRTLFPEKYRPKPRPAETAAPASRPTP